MKTMIPTLFFGFYILSLHTSMAGMEVFASLLTAYSIILFTAGKVKFGTPFQMPIGVFIISIFVNFLFVAALVPWNSRLDELRWIFTYWGLTKALESIWSDRFEKILLKTWVIGLLAAGSYGAFQFFSGIDLFRAHSAHIVQYGEVYRATGFFSLALTYAYSIGHSGLAVSFPSNILTRKLPYLLIGFTLTIIIMSLTRGAWVAMYLSSIILIAVFHKSIRRHHWTLMSIAGICSIIALFSIGGAQERISKSMLVQNDADIGARFEIWKAYFQMFLDHPLFGVGFQQGQFLLEDYYERLGIVQELQSHAHNDYLQSLSETGLIGFLAFIFLFGSIAKKTWDLRQYRPDWSASLLFGQLFILVGCFTQANFTDAEVNHFLIFNWAIVSTLIIRQNQE